MTPKYEWRVGTVTLGLLFVALGVIFLLSRLLPGFEAADALRFWPVMLILIGAEILLSVALARGCPVRFRIDWVSVVLIVLVSFSAAGLAAMDYCLRAFGQLRL